MYSDKKKTHTCYFPVSSQPAHTLRGGSFLGPPSTRVKMTSQLPPGPLRSHFVEAWTKAMTQGLSVKLGAGRPHWQGVRCLLWVGKDQWLAGWWGLRGDPLWAVTLTALPPLGSALRSSPHLHRPPQITRVLAEIASFSAVQSSQMHTRATDTAQAGAPRIKAGLDFSVNWFN